MSRFLVQSAARSLQSGLEQGELELLLSRTSQLGLERRSKTNGYSIRTGRTEVGHAVGYMRMHVSEAISSIALVSFAGSVKWSCENHYHQLCETCNLHLVKEEAMKWAAWAIILPLFSVGIGFTNPVRADGWEWVPADPPVTLPDLISKGGEVEGWLAGRASNFIPNMEADSDFTAAGYLISHDGNLYRCITQDSESVGNGNCSVAVNK